LTGIFSTKRIVKGNPDEPDEQDRHSPKSDIIKRTNFQKWKFVSMLERLGIGMLVMSNSIESSHHNLNKETSRITGSGRLSFELR
jgi:hypothetical protein